MRKKKRSSLKPPPPPTATSLTPLPALACASGGGGHQEQLKSECFQGERLNDLLQKLAREIELGKLSKGELPYKIWIKQQISIGVNDVTRVLERMSRGETRLNADQPSTTGDSHKAPLVPFQAVLLASDCNPRCLTKHVSSLASSRSVPIIFIRDNKGGSLRLGELVKLKTAMAIGVKARGSRINKIIDEVLNGIGWETLDASKVS